MGPIIFISVVSMVLILMLYWVLSHDKGRESLRPRDSFQYETAQELFNYVDEEVYLGEDDIRLVRIASDRIRVYWNLSADKWQSMGGPGDNKKPREPFLRLCQAGDLLRTFDTSLRQKIGHFDFDLPVGTACYSSIGYKENGRFSPLMTSHTIMRQC